MTARDAAELRNRQARALLAVAGEVLPEAARRPARTRRPAAVIAPLVINPALPVTVADLDVDERSIYDHLVSRIDASAAAAVDLVDHFARAARESARARRASA